MRLIDADALDESMCKFSDATGEDMTHAIFYAHIAPTVDAVPVIRCVDCKWYEFDRKLHCGLPHGVRSKNDYCSDAERKEE